MRRPGSSGDPDNITGAGSRYEALKEVLEQQARQADQDRERELREQRRSRSRSRLPLWPVVILAVVAVWLWVLPPPFLRVDEPPPPPVAEEEAALRFAIYVQAQRVEAYRTEADRLPATLEEVGPPLPRMEYVRLTGDLYQLTGRTDRVHLTYRSDLPLDDFVGSGAEVLDESRVR